MNAIVKAEPQQKLMLLDYMADKYSLNPEEFSRTVKAMCGLSAATPEQFAAFLLVAKTYNLNPLIKEIYAFPAKGGGIVPIVSIDGWVNLVNSHPACNGFQFEADHSADGKLISYTCNMHRKDRDYPVNVTEYLSECIRSTEPWKMQHRMLRHKSMIQASRYAFGFAGIYDEDEGRVIAESGEAVPVGPRDTAPPRNVKTIEHQPSGTTQDEPEKPAESTAREGEGNTQPPPTAPSEPPKAVVPHDLVPQQGDSYEIWAKRYIAALETSPDTSAVFKWVDLNQPRLKKLEGSPEWTGKVKKATQTIVDRLRKAADPITSGPQAPAEPQDMFPGDRPMPSTQEPDAAPRPRGRPPKAKVNATPDFLKDYDGWLSWNIDRIAKVDSVEALESVFSEIDENWLALMPPDKTALTEARSLAEDRLAP